MNNGKQAFTRTAYRRNARMKTVKMVELAILMAIVAVLQITGTGLRLGGTSISLVLIPIALGAMLVGPWAGALLGCEFGAIVYIMGFTGVDMFTFILIQDHPIYTALICFGKGIAAGLASGYVYMLLKNKSLMAAVITASAVAPIVNTGLFVLGALFMQSTIASNFLAEGQTVIYFLVIICAGLNFIFEFGLNLLVSPALTRVVETVNRRIAR